MRIRVSITTPAFGLRRPNLPTARRQVGMAEPKAGVVIKNPNPHLSNSGYTTEAVLRPKDTLYG